MSALQSGDKPAAFKGLVVTFFLLLAMAYGIVLLTNMKFAGHEAEPAAATQGH